MDKEKLIKLGLEKINHKNNLRWSEIASMCGCSDAETARQIVKKHRYKKGVVKGLYQKDKTKILAISDLHIPFNLPKEVLKDYVGKTDILVINGDVMDCQSLSKFNKKYRVPFINELIMTRNYLIDLINYIKPKKVLINFGNHCVRVSSYFSEKLHEDLMSLMPNTSLDFLIDSGFYHYDHEHKTKTFYEPLSKVFKDEVEVVYTNNWWCKVGKTIFTHPKAFKSGLLSTVEKSYLYYLQHGESFDCIVMAHTHASGIMKYGKAYLIEQGSLCKEQEYALSGSLQRPQSQGFMFVVQDKDGKFLYNDSKLVILE